MSRLVAAALGGAWTTAARATAEQRPPGGRQAWLRANHRGGEVSLLGGLAAASGACVAAASVGGRAGAGAVVAIAAAGGLGALDDHREDVDGQAKGLRGHMRALATGRVTTGGAKLLGISASAVVAAALATGGGRRGSVDASTARRWMDVVSSGALIAGTANLVNLLDLRPGRALKVTALASIPLLAASAPASELAAGALGAAVAGLPGDLAETTMLGDTGANALGAALGSALAASDSAWLRAGALAAVVGLTLTSERVSFTRVIEATPVLREVDAWGRQPSP